MLVWEVLFDFSYRLTFSYSLNYMKMNIMVSCYDSGFYIDQKQGRNRIPLFDFLKSTKIEFFLRCYILVFQTLLKMMVFIDLLFHFL